MAKPDIETATFRLVAQCLNQMPHYLFPYNVIGVIKIRRKIWTVYTYAG
jgi:hypothetical protein